MILGSVMMQQVNLIPTKKEGFLQDVFYASGSPMILWFKDSQYFPWTIIP